MHKYKIICPHCGTKTRVYASSQPSNMVRETYCKCPNVKCRHVFVVHTVPVRTIAPSDNPRDDVSLPISPPYRSEKKDDPPKDSGMSTNA